MKTGLPRTIALAMVLFCSFFLLRPGTLLAGNILDKAGNPTATPLVAFSLRQLSSAYMGSAIQVRRSSDNTTQNIGFNPAGDLDTTALKAFIGSGDGYVTTWYDQSGYGYNATQATIANQPLIVSGGVINRDNGQPSIYTSGTGWLTYGPIGQLNGSTQVTRMEVTRSRIDSFGITEGLGNFQLDLQLFPDRVMVQFETGNITASGTVANPRALMAINSVRNNGNSRLYVNTALADSTTAGIMTFNAPVGYVGIRFDYLLGNANLGAFSETILFNSVLTDADRQAINYNENWYYSLGFAPCSSTQSILSANGTTTKALYACKLDPLWAYYYDPVHPLNLLFGIAKDPGNTGANPTFMADSINLTVTNDPTIDIFSAFAGTEGITTLGRYWNVYTHTPLTSPVNIRFFYSLADTVPAYRLAQDLKNAFGVGMISNLQWFKTVGNPYTPDSLTATPKATVKGAHLTLTPVYGTTADGINYVEFDGVTSFSGGTGFYIWSNTLASLPDIIGAFTGRRVNETTMLNWTTESESNSERFDVQRSTDSKTWATIGQVKAAGNSSTPLSYGCTDTTSLHGENNLYYRLRLVDLDGQNTSSGVLLLKTNGNTMPAPQLSRIVPNPFANEMEITCTVPASGPVELLLQDMAGATLVRREYAANKGDNVFRLTNLNGLTKGAYIIRVVQGGTAAIGKVIKQ